MSRGLTILLLLSFAPASTRGADGVPLKRIQNIHVPEHANQYEKSAVKLLQEKLLWNPFLDTTRVVRRWTGVLPRVRATDTDP